MQSSFKDVAFITPMSMVEYESLLTSSPMMPFNDEVINYLHALSTQIKKDPRVREYPDVATFAFFCRRANILKLKQQYMDDDSIRLGRGIVFHIAPSNVPVNFAYSLITGLLAGNSNIVRVSSKNFEQVSIISEAINTLAGEPEFAEIAKRIVLIQYDRASNATKEFSAICDVRVIWGGDETIQQIRSNPLPARAFDITFADRYSLCVIQANKYVNESAPEKIATGFYNDTYLFDQNACTSPHLIIWLGSPENIEKAQGMFWDSLYKEVQNKYTLQSVQAINKLTTFYSQSISQGKIAITDQQDNVLWRIKLDDLSQNIDQFRCSSGYFSEYNAESITELSNIVNRKYQTLAYYGFSKTELSEFIREAKLMGIDRVVPIGRTADFSLTWDGYQLVDSLSRSIELI